MFISFLLFAEQKKRNEPKKRKLRRLQYRLRRHKTAYAVIYGFAL